MPPVPAVYNQFERAKSRALVLAKGRLVAIAKGKHAAIMGRYPRPVGFTRFVDGRMGVLETAVNVFGVIHYIYDRSQIGFERDLKQTVARLDEIALYALEILRSISPVGSGKDPHPGLYRDSHVLFLNKQPVDNLSAWKPGDEISISNEVEYSRIIEVGNHKGRLPLLVYDRAKDIVDEKYGSDAKIEFTWRGIITQQFGKSGPNPYRRTGPKPGRATRRPGAIQNRSEIRYPTIVITPKAILLGDVLNKAVQIANRTANVLNAVNTLYVAGLGLSIGRSDNTLYIEDAEISRRWIQSLMDKTK